MNLFEAVKANVNAADVAAMAGLHPNRNKMICCPFHNDRHPSMRVDKRYYCFGCGAKGDAIDFAANYYGLGPRAAAEKIASDFAIPYDNVRYSDHFQKEIAVKKNEHQIWAEKKRCLYARLSALHEKLRQMKTEYAPKTREESTWDPLFSLAVNEFTYQRPFMQEDTWTGLIQEWLDHTTNDVVCVQQIYNEALKEFGKPRNSEAREIGQIMNGTISGWKAYPNPRNIPGYGKQRGWMRMETNSGNKEETFIPVEGTQLEIPFES